MGFENSKTDTSMFFKIISTSMLIIFVYVGDITIIGSDSQTIHKLTKLLNSRFALKELGDLNFFLGIEVTCSGDTMHLS